MREVPRRRLRPRRLHRGQHLVPNTKNLRALQGESELENLVKGITAKREALKEARNGKHVPIAVKLAPDLENDEILRCVDTLMAHGIDGVIATNTTIARKRVEGLNTRRKRAASRARPFVSVRPKSSASLRSTSRANSRSLRLAA